MFRTTFLIPLAALGAACFPDVGRATWYGGLSAGSARTHGELVRNRESTLTEAADLRTDFDDRHAAWKGYAGFRFNPVMAVEIAYADLGEHGTLTRLQGGSPPLPASIAVRRKLSGYGVDLVATAPLGWERGGLFARVGSFRARLEASAELGGNIVFTGGDPDERVRTTTRRETVLKVGLGGEYRLTRNLWARLEWERYHAVGKPFAVGGSGTTGEADTDVVSLGLRLGF